MPPQSPIESLRSYLGQEGLSAFADPTNKSNVCVGSDATLSFNLSVGWRVGRVGLLRVPLAIEGEGYTEAMSSRRGLNRNFELIAPLRQVWKRRRFCRFVGVLAAISRLGKGPASELHKKRPDPTT